MAADWGDMFSRVTANASAADERKELDAKKREARGLRDALTTGEEKLAGLTAKKEKLTQEAAVLQERVNTVSMKA